jgi:multicomponent Na+:H+ antiporter subunit G
VIDVIADVLVIVGLAITTVGVYGLVRLPDAYTQVHAASKATFLGVALVLVAATRSGDGAIIARVILIISLLTITTPVASHAVARAARRRAEPMRSPDAVDES